MPRAAILVILLSPLLASAAIAADKLKPGLWEIKMKSDAIKDIPKIAPEQLEEMRSMGIHVPQIQHDGIVTKVCLTKDMVEQDQMPIGPNETGCQAKNYQRHGNSYGVDVSCNGAGLKGSGVLRGKILDRENFSSVYEFKGTAHGQSIAQQHEQKGKWIAAKCGKVEPSEVTPKGRK